MKILYCVNLFPSTSQTFVLTQMREVRRRGHEVFVYALQHDPDAKKHATLPAEDICNKVWYAPALPASKLGRLAHVARVGLFKNASLSREAIHPSVFGARNCCSLRRLVNAIDLADVVESLRPDVVHVHFGTNAEAPLCCKRAGLLGQAGLMVTFHGFDLAGRAPFYPALFEAANLFTVNSEYMRGLAQSLGCPPKRTRKLPMGIDPNLFRRSSSGPRDDATLSILYVGRLVEVKGPDMALRAFARLRQMTSTPCTLTFIGDGPMRDELSRLILELGVADQVSLAGACPQEHVLDAMDRASVVILSGREDANGLQETQGLVIQEAQAMEIPLVAADTGGVSEGMEDGRSGFLVPPDDVEAAAERLKQLVLDPALRATMGRRGRELVLERFDVSRLTEELESIYEAL